MASQFPFGAHYASNPNNGFIWFVSPEQQHIQLLNNYQTYFQSVMNPAYYGMQFF